MRVGSLAALPFAFALLALALPRAASPSLQDLYESRDWFALRDAVDSSRNAPALYRGAVALAFHDFPTAHRALRSVADGTGNANDAIEARARLITLAQLEGDYPAALREILALRALVADASGLENGAAFFGALARLPRQAVRRHGAGSVPFSIRGGNLFIPVSINGRSATFLVDTGANFSLLAESEAKRLGITISEATGAHATDASGTAAGVRLGVADRLDAGQVELTSVVFEVARDDQQPFVDLPDGSRGVLGLPVLLAMRTVRWHDDGRFDIGVAPSARGRPRSNLCFDDANVVVEAEYRGRPVQALLDTGASKTRFMAAFARAFPGVIAAAPRESTTIRGVAGARVVQSARLTRPAVRIDGHDLTVPSVDVVLEATGTPADRRQVWIGLDLFRDARRVTIDLQAMRLGVE